MAKESSQVIIIKSYLRRCFLRAAIFGSVLLILSCLATIMTILNVASEMTLAVLFLLFLPFSVAGFLIQEKIESKNFTVRTVKLRTEIIDQLGIFPSYQIINSNFHYQKYPKIKFNISFNNQFNSQWEDVVDRLDQNFDIDGPSYGELVKISY